MKKERVLINDIPAVIWGNDSDKVYIAVHGNMSNKEDEVIQILAEIAINRGFQVLSFDLPEHGERANNKEYLCKVQNCISDLNKIMEYAKNRYKAISLWACSMGAYFSLFTYKNEDIDNCLFLSPVVNMKVVIDNMMTLSNVTEDMLKEKQEIKTDFGAVLYWDYYEFVKENPINIWNKKTSILYGNKDNMQDEVLIKDFANRFNCNLSIVENCEHYFHTEEQLNLYEKWLSKIV